MAGRLIGKVALVTGGSSGIGRASALALAMEDATVIVADVDQIGGVKTIEEIKKSGGQAVFCQTDITDAAQIESLMHRITELYGRLDYAHNNAGILGDIALTTDSTEENWDHVINTNLKGTWLCLKYEVQQMLQQGGGVIVNTASVYGLVGCRQGLAAYVASKHGIVGLTKSIALEYAQAGIRINAICPAVIPTPMVEHIFSGCEQVKENFEAIHPVGRMGTPEEVAGTVVWLFSDAAAFITGHSLVMDGGLTVQ